MAKPKTIIHVGLHKTGSTLLQALWALMPEVNLSKEYSIKTCYRLRDVIWGNTTEDFGFPEGLPVFDGPAKVDDAFSVFSAENLSNPCLKPFTRERFDLYYRYTPQIFGQMAPGDASVLALVREPISWIRSMHKQHIHEGGSQTLQKFVASNADALAYILSLTPMLGPWAERYGKGNIVVLPYELMRERKADFYRALNKYLGLPPNAFDQDVRLNVSVSDEEAELMRMTSRMMQLFLRNIPMSPSVADQFQKNSSVISGFLRNELQKDGVSRMNRLAKHMALEFNSDLRLPDGLRRAIEEQFLPTVEELGKEFKPYLPRYRAALADACAD
ncbi:MAG: hypothetical protein EP335_13565 [Alphaproteobacteria bacterium]|nr:MAG: hypothetical protein EP335_13565 [Alphaproteobacteria bacterium]